MWVRLMWCRVATTHESRQMRLSVVRWITRLATLGRSDELGARLGLFRTKNRAVLVNAAA